MTEVTEWASNSELVKRLFGKASRVALAHWILLRHEEFFLTEAQRAMIPFGIVGSAVSKDLSDFCTYHMLSSSSRDRRVYFQQAPTPLWDAYSAIALAAGL